MQPIAPTDALFLVGESREHPMHVAGLQLFQPPPDAGPEFLRGLYDALLAQTDVQPTFRKRPAFAGAITNLVWAVDKEVELDYHLRRSALPAPGRVRDLLELASRLHGSLLDRHRPLWESHLIEGLDDGRFAVYTKFHHALIDGVSAMKLMQRALSEDPADTEVRAPWCLRPRRRSAQGADTGLPLLRTARRLAGAITGIAPTTLTLARSALLEQELMLPFRAPKTMLNVRIGGARRVAAQSWPLERIRNVKAAAGVTVNDVALAMCAGALRGYLTDLDALPDTPLVAMVPVNLRTENDTDGGNLVGAVLCNLATDLDDPAERLRAITESMRRTKRVYADLPRTHQLAVSALLVGGVALGLLPGFVRTAPPPFNIVISNVPGARAPLYFGGARLDGNYPLSIPLDGLALNITLASYAGNLDFGLVGCRRSVPRLQRLLDHLETALKDLEQAVGA